jgi:hypothetical protein
MKKITFDFAPYVLNSWDVMVTRYNDGNEILSQTKFIAHKINGELVFENFEDNNQVLNDAEKNYIQSILNNS